MEDICSNGYGIIFESSEGSFMVKMVKSAVKCYKKKTKKSVGGQRKTYEYNQYLVPLKRSDDLDCSMEVFIIPENDINHFLNEEGELKDISNQENKFKIHIAQYKNELADLEWKHNQLSKSYKDLLNKHNKTRRKQQELEVKIKNLENDKNQLIEALKKEKSISMVPELVNQEVMDEVSDSKTINTSLGSDKIKASIEKSSGTNETSDNKEKDDKDFWTVIKSRLAKRGDDEKDK